MIKKFLIAIFALAVTTSAHAASSYGGYYVDTDKGAASGGSAYISAAFDLNMATFTNDYSLASNPSATGGDSYSFAQQMGFDAAVGYEFAPKWRAELNYGFTGTHSDKDADGTFDISAQQISLNLIYTIKKWTDTSIYAGFGAGAAQLKTSLTHLLFDPSAETTKTSVVLMGRLMIGIEEQIAQNLYLGLGYKLSYMTGHTQKLLMKDSDIFIADISDIFTNTFSLGLRYSF